MHDKLADEVECYNVWNVLRIVTLAKCNIIDSELMCFEWLPGPRATSINVESPIYAHFPCFTFLFYFYSFFTFHSNLSFVSVLVVTFDRAICVHVNIRSMIP